MNIFKELKKLNLPEGEYVVVGGALTAHKIREANDLDILVTPKLYQKLQKQGFKPCLCKKCIQTSRIILKKGKIDIIPNFMLGDYIGDTKMLIKSASIINGFPFIRLNELKKFKKELGRKKDFDDIKLINEYLRN